MDLQGVFVGESFSPVISFPRDYHVYDFSIEQPTSSSTRYSLGRYNEHRPFLYKGDLFEEDARTVHMGLDFGAPVGSEIFSFANGVVVYMDYNSAPFDYGYTVVTKHSFNECDVYALYGHLSKKTFSYLTVGQTIEKGELIAWLGDESENGGWPSHLHFQLSLIDPKKADMPGVVSLKDRDKAVLIYPDPQLVLGPLY